MIFSIEILPRRDPQTLAFPKVIRSQSTGGRFGTLVIRHRKKNTTEKRIQNNAVNVKIMLQMAFPSVADAIFSLIDGLRAVYARA